MRPQITERSVLVSEVVDGNMTNWLCTLLTEAMRPPTVIVFVFGLTRPMLAVVPVNAAMQFVTVVTDPVALVIVMPIAEIAVYDEMEASGIQRPAIVFVVPAADSVTLIAATFSVVVNVVADAKYTTAEAALVAEILAEELVMLTCAFCKLAVTETQKFLHDSEPDKK